MRRFEWRSGDESASDSPVCQRQGAPCLAQPNFLSRRFRFPALDLYQSSLRWFETNFLKQTRGHPSPLVQPRGALSALFTEKSATKNLSIARAYLQRVLPPSPPSWNLQSVQNQPPDHSSIRATSGGTPSAMREKRISAVPLSRKPTYLTKLSSFLMMRPIRSSSGRSFPRISHSLDFK